MLIICSGPDTWHARQKASELVSAFRTKHDPQGLSTENLRNLDFQALLNQLASPSLFATKRCIRCDGLLDALKIADIRKLAKRLKDDADQTILITTEDEPTSTKIIAEFSEIKCVEYPYPLLQPSAFLKWCTTRAIVLSLDEKTAAEVARLANGDIWFAEQELMKKSAYPKAELTAVQAEASSAFDIADKYLTQRSGWRGSIAAAKDDQVSIVLASQSRSALRVADHETAGMHPYVAKKLSQLRIPSPAKSFLKSIKALVGIRQGFVDADESQTML